MSCLFVIDSVLFTLLELAKDLTQEQYIDEVVFKCTTLECDLSRAVARLTAGSGQFAGE